MPANFAQTMWEQRALDSLGGPKWLQDLIKRSAAAHQAKQNDEPPDKPTNE